MKKLLYIFILTLSVIIAGCDSDESSVSILKVVQSNTTFKAAGGDGSILIEATGSVTAVSNADWCTILETDNEKVTFKVKENDDFPGRSTQIIIRNETSTQKITVTQQGAIIIYDENDLEQAVSDAKTSLTIALNGSFPFKVTIPEKAKSWLSYELVDEGIQFNFEENTTHAPRGTGVEVSIGSRTAKYVMMQYDAKDLLGSWVASFNRYWQQEDSSGKGPAEIKEGIDKGTYLISFPAATYIPITLIATYANKGFQIAASQFLGESEATQENGETIPLYLHFGLASYSKMYWLPTQSINLNLTMIDGELVLIMQDNSSAEQDTLTDILIGFFLEKGNLTQAMFVAPLTIDIYNLKLYK